MLTVTPRFWTVWEREILTPKENTECREWHIFQFICIWYWKDLSFVVIHFQLIDVHQSFHRSYSVLYGSADRLELESDASNCVSSAYIWYYRPKWWMVKPSCWIKETQEQSFEDPCTLLDCSSINLHCQELMEAVLVAPVLCCRSAPVLVYK